MVYWNQVLIAVEKQKVAEKEAETQKKIALANAEKNSEVSKITMEQMLMEKNSDKRQQEIENEVYLAREKSLADANFYRFILSLQSLLAILKIIDSAVRNII